MTGTPVDVPEPLFQALARELSPEAIVELATAVATENFSARFNHAFLIQAQGLTAAWERRHSS